MSDSEYCEVDVTDEPQILEEIDTVSRFSSDWELLRDQSSALRDSVSVVDDMTLRCTKDLMRGLPGVTDSTETTEND